MSIGVNKFKSQEAHSLSLTSLSINKLKCQLFPQSTTLASLVWASTAHSDTSITPLPQVSQNQLPWVVYY